MTVANGEILKVENLSVRLPPSGDRPFALENFSLTISAGETVCLVGESGSGKSMLAGAIMRLLPEPHVRVSKGTIRFGQEDLLAKSEAEMRAIRGNKISMIFQDPMTALNPQKTVGWQIDEVLKLHTNLNRKERGARAIELLERVHIPAVDSKIKAYPHQLSGGQRQRVMIAMSLALSPKLIIADEPTTALDVTTQKQILKLIRELRDDLGSGVLMITHDFGVVAEIADRVAVLCNGELVEEGKVAEVLDHPKHAYTQSLIRAVPSLSPPPAKCFDAEPVVLRVSNLRKTFRIGGAFFGKGGREVAAVAGLSLILHKGETVGIVGESGSGKTTVSRIVTRLLEADSGEMMLEGVDMMRVNVRELRELRRRIQIIFQDPMASLNPRKRVVDIIAQGPIIHGEDRRKARARAMELLRLVELTPTAGNRFPHEFSGGQRQRIGIARALAMQPIVIVADEPVSALDVSVQAQVIKLIQELRDKLGLSMLFVTHDLRVAAQLCDSVVVMQNGRIVEAGRTADVFSRPQHLYTQALLAAVPGRDWEPTAVRQKSDEMALT